LCPGAGRSLHAGGVRLGFGLAVRARARTHRLWSVAHAVRDLVSRSGRSAQGAVGDAFAGVRFRQAGLSILGGNRMTLLVTGAMGHVGYEVVCQAARRGMDVVALYRDELREAEARSAGAGVRWLRCELGDA